MEAVLTKGQTSVPCSQRNSKKYSKVNEELKKEFLFLIILHNKSIKEVFFHLFRPHKLSTSTIAVRRQS